MFFSTIRSFIKSASPSRNSIKTNSMITTQSSESHSRSSSQEKPTIPKEIASLISSKKMKQFSSVPHIHIISKMGDGAFSNVYRAYDEKLEKEVAVKVVDKRGLTPSQRNFIHKEVTILRACNHPNIVSLYEFIETPQHYFLVIELVSGGEIFNEIISHVYFSEPMACHIINQVAAGIAYLHKSQGVVHRDIKPENILFEPIDLITDPEPYISKGYVVHEGREGEGYIVEGIGGAGIGKIKIADFGLSKRVLDSSTQTPCGTVGYTAPEIVKDEKYSYSVDMWALGCVLYTLLCGFPPFYDEDIHVLTEKVAQGYFEFLSPWWDGISDSAKNLVSRMLAVNPAQRYTAETFFTHPWTQTFGSSSSTAVPKPLGLITPITPSVTLKEAFDVSYAVQIMQDEESSRRNTGRSGARSGPKKKHLEGTLNSSATGSTTSVSIEDNYEAINHLYDQQQQHKVFSRGAFEDGGSFNLSLTNSTLIGKRKVKAIPAEPVISKTSLNIC
ncbi:MAPK-activated protein kinase Srk1 [Entomophthora muscae]|uniref:MAPK-activated protein kinase Srk1 n=1 Tax=Entomophthora muscae TaxID=34485 RepID=A0ACC2UU05_9FUNG|nr:MAPK-activated protein kinase Srk1 [Entomophthora muscae]